MFCYLAPVYLCFSQVKNENDNVIFFASVLTITARVELGSVLRLFSKEFCVIALRRYIE